MTRSEMIKKFGEFGIGCMDPNYLADLIEAECSIYEVEFTEIHDIEPVSDDEDVVTFKDPAGKNWEVVYDWA